MSVRFVPPPDTPRIVAGPCRHEHVEPVRLLTREVVATLCVRCYEQLPPSWGCGRCEYADVQRLADPWPRRIMVQPCDRHRA